MHQKDEYTLLEQIDISEERLGDLNLPTTFVRVCREWFAGPQEAGDVQLEAMQSFKDLELRRSMSIFKLTDGEWIYDFLGEAHQEQYDYPLEGRCPALC